MSENFVMAMAEVPGPSWDKRASEYVRTMKAAVDKLLCTDLDYARELVGGDSDTDEEVKEAIRRAIDDVFDADSMAHTFIHIGDSWYAITGGLSFGSEPTGTFSSVGLLSVLTDSMDLWGGQKK